MKDPILHLELGQIVCPTTSCFLVQLCRDVGFPPNPGPGYTIENLLSIIFQRHAPDLTKNHFPLPNHPLTTKIFKLEEPLYELAREIAVGHGFQIGKFDEKCFLTLLKSAFPPYKAGGVLRKKGPAARRRAF